MDMMDMMDMMDGMDGRYGLGGQDGEASCCGHGWTELKESLAYGKS